MINFLPFVGANYEHSIYGVKILVLGESHYADEGDEGLDFTQKVVADLAYSSGSSFFSKLTKVLRRSRDEPSDEQRKSIWQNVAFYNYIQQFVGNASRIPPTEKMWEYAKSPFLEVVNELKPDIILVVGSSLGDSLPALPQNNDIEVCYIKHPAGGLAYDEAFNNFQYAINTATAKKK